MNERTWKLFYILMIFGAIITIVVDYRIALGYLLGSAEALIHYKRLEKFWNGVIDVGVSHKSTGVMHFTFTFAMMACVLLICAFLPNIFNIYACAVGMLLIKVTTYIDLLIHKEDK